MNNGDGYERTARGSFHGLTSLKLGHQLCGVQTVHEPLDNLAGHERTISFDTFSPKQLTRLFDGGRFQATNL